MTFPFFYVRSLETDTVFLDEETSKHLSVLRIKKEDQILLTDGKGKKAEASIIDDNRKKYVAKIFSQHSEEERSKRVCLAVSLLKNTSRFEWFLEKATEIGVSEIIPLICHRTEKQNFKYDRMNAILVSAMLQSQQCRLPNLHQPELFEKVLSNSYEQKFIAHCLGEEKPRLSSLFNHLSSLILIGPEGDFTKVEIDKAMDRNFEPVSLGSTRLRTETAGVVAATFLCN